MPLTLYIGSRRSSSWSLRAHLALAHSGVAFETRVILLDRPDTAANIAAVNATGRVPVLYDDGFAIWDSLAICEYAAELAPGAKLWPVDRRERARARSLSAEMHSSFSALRESMPFAPLERRPGRGHTAATLADVQRIQTIWREALAVSGGPFLFSTYSIADMMFAPVATRFVTYGVELDATCRAYVDTIFAVPAMKQWLADAVDEPVAPGAP